MSADAEKIVLETLHISGKLALQMDEDWQKLCRGIFCCSFFIMGKKEQERTFFFFLLASEYLEQGGLKLQNC